MTTLDQLLRECIARQASDLHLSTGLPPMVRRHGDMDKLSDEALSEAHIRTMLDGIMNAEMRARFEQTLELDFAIDVPELSRFRVNAFEHTRGVGAVLRAIPSRVSGLAEINAPAALAELMLQPRGLILVTGPTGSGKSTTLAAMVDHFNGHVPGHVLTIEDPVEFIHAPKMSLVNQREVGTHTHQFANALRAALREDPDVILVGELRDLETIRLAMTAAETGHLVLATTHTSSAPKTIDRVIDVFPGDEKAMIRMMLSESLVAVISQTLCKRKDGQGRVAAHEIMMGTPAIRNLIREGKVAQMYSAIQTGMSQGMQTLDQSLQQLMQKGLIDAQEAKRHAHQPQNF
ncbi:MAG: Twitching mobility protein [Pseudomonadota bacterium]|jgi:twitching motility protein PilT